MEQNKLVVFGSKKIRRIWHKEEWYFSVVDVCGALTNSPDAGAYWRKLKQRLNEEGSEVVTFCHGLKLEAANGKKLINPDFKPLEFERFKIAESRNDKRVMTDEK